MNTILGIATFLLLSLPTTAQENKIKIASINAGIGSFCFKNFIFEVAALHFQQVLLVVTISTYDLLDSLLVPQ